MSTVIQIKRSTGVSAPTASDLAQGELAYSMDASNNGSGAILYVCLLYTSAAADE